MPGGILYSQDTFDNNVVVVNKLIDESFTPLSNKLIISGKDNFYQVNYNTQDPASSYLFERFRNGFRDYKLILNEDFDSIDYRIDISDVNINTKYTKIFTDNVLGVKKIEREILVSYNLKLTAKDSSKIIFNQNFSKKSKDSIELDKLNYAEDKRYDFSSSSLPEESSLNQILFPALIITASAAAIILFFTIRSR